MTSPSDGSLINRDRMKREVKCLNDKHELMKFITDEILPKCPICNNLMVTIVKSVVEIPVKNELAK